VAKGRAAIDRIVLAVFARHMELAFHRPGPPLSAHVEAITCFDGFVPAHHREKLIPDGAIELIVDLGETPKKLYADETSALAVDFRRAWISGMQRRWIVIEAQPNSSLLVIRFRPGGAHAIIALDAAALTDAVFSLEDVFGRAAVSLRERVLAASGSAARIAAAEAWLAERIGDACIHPVVGHVIGRLENPIGLRVRDLAEEVGFSERHMLTLFRQQVGIAPKQYARIRRFNRLLAGLARTGQANVELRGARLPEPDWAELAAAYGYADQSHLSHEFAAFAGMSPGAYVRAYRGLENYLPITLAQ
jgi:AraC-like DNA-binding protein